MKGYFLKVNESEEGKSIEEVIRKCMADKTPIENVITPMYTEKEDGVLAETNVRTDRWELAQKATDKITMAEIAKAEEAVNVEPKEPE